MVTGIGQGGAREGSEQGRSGIGGRDRAQGQCRAVQGRDRSRTMAGERWDKGRDSIYRCRT